MFLTSIYNQNILIDVNSLVKQNNIDIFLLNQLKKLIGNKCNSDGLIIKDTIQIINRNIGTFNLNHQILYKVTYKAAIFYPNEGTILDDCKIIFNSDVLYIAQYKKYNCIIILPKAFLKTNLDLKKKNLINVICLDKYYELNDSLLFIIGIPTENNTIPKDITSSDNNDLKCSEIFDNITEFKNDYYNLFYENLEQEDTNTLDINYDLYDSTSQQLYISLQELKKDIISYITENKLNFDLLYIENINNIYDLYIILDYLHINLNNNLYYNFKKSLYNNFNEEIYNTNKDTDLNATLQKLNTNDGILNNQNYCNLISIIQFLKNSKLFLHDFKKIEKNTIVENKLDIFNELEELLFNNKNNISDLVNLLTTYFKQNNINFDFDSSNDINDLIFRFFNVIYSIPNLNYTKHQYDLINDDEYIENIPVEKNSLDIQPINKIILEIKKEVDKSPLKYFYNITCDEYKCSNCNYKSFTFKNVLINDLFINKNNYTTINSYVKSKFNNNIFNLVSGLKCPICSNISIHKNTSLYCENIDYFMCSINRLDFKPFSLDKNKHLINIDNRLSIQTIDIENSNSELKYKTTVFDLKSAVIHNGSYSNGHYFTINKTKNDIFYLYNDNNHYKINFVDFFNELLYKSNSHTLIYQSNLIHDLPLSNISLLEYEDNLLNGYNNTIMEYIKTKTKIGVHLGPQVQLGSGLFENLKNIHYLYNNYSSLITIDDFKNILNDFCSIYLNTPNLNASLQKFNSDYEKIKNKEILIKEFITDIQYNLQSVDNLFYYYFIFKVIHKIENTFDFKNQLSFIDNIDFLKNKNIFIGTAGYNTSETNYWDIIYQRSTNNLELYSEHLNSIEINHSYYNDYQEDHWSDIHSKIKSLQNKLSLSIVFNKELSELITNMRNYKNKNENDFIKIFDKYFKNKIDILKDFIHNIVFKFENKFNYDSINFKNLQLFTKIKELPLIKDNNINLIFEFYNNSWYSQQEVIDYFIENDLSMITLIYNNDDNRFGNTLESNLYNNQSSQLKYVNHDFKINYIKLYGSISKYAGTHTKEIPYLVKNIKDKLNLQLLDKIPQQINNKQYIYFNNVERDKFDNKYKDDEDNTNIPGAVYDSKLFYKSLKQLDIV